MIALIANPAAGRGRGARHAAAAEAALADAGAVRVYRTTKPGEEATLARRAADDGATTIAALGGDGTWGNVAGALVAAKSDIALALLAAGTGNDFVKTVAAPAYDFAATARLIADGQTRRVDVGRVNDRVFLNAAGFGFDAAVCEMLQRPTLLRGKAVYVATALRQLFTYRGLPMSLDDGPTRKRLMLVFSNGRWFGGTFAIAPNASPFDGSLDVTSIEDAKPWRRAILFARAMRGTHVHAPEVESLRVASTQLRFNEPPIFESDGEFARASSREVTVESVPRALRIVVAGA
jgi:diacylglycerol kinase (ATP)